MFSDDCNWDTPKYVKDLNETIFKPHAEKDVSKKRSHVHVDTKKQPKTNVVGETKVNTSVKPFKAPKDTFVVPADIILGHHNPSVEKVSGNVYSVECAKKKRKSKHCVTAEYDDHRTSGAIAVDQCSLLAVTKPHVKVKPEAKCNKTAKKCLKLGCCYNTNDATSLSFASSHVHETLPVDCSLPSKKRKMMQNRIEVNSVKKLKKIRTVDSMIEKVCAVADELSVGQNKCNFNIVKLRSALQQSGRLPDTVSEQDRLNDDKASYKNRALQIGQETATASAKYEKNEADISSSGKSSLHSEMVSASSSSSLLKECMMNQLKSARFRFINEQMYRSTGSEAAEMFARDKDAFTVYHAGFQSQVSKWPTNPVDKMIDYISSSGTLATVADFGCGDAKIARTVLNVVHSFDLVALNEHVTACDMAHVPLKKASVDIAVFCLSLMGTNAVQYLAEASRVLKLGGVLLIAEVVSRFQKIGSFVRKLRKLGFELENKVVNKMFVWFEMKKTCALPPEDSFPFIELYPCVYKKR